MFLEETALASMGSIVSVQENFECETTVSVNVLYIHAFLSFIRGKSFSYDSGRNPYPIRVPVSCPNCNLLYFQDKEGRFMEST